MPDIVSYNGRQNWEVVADKYCKQLLARIPKVYRLTELQVEDARNQERLTGAYIDQFLEKSELKVLGLDSSNLVYEIACGAISAAQAAQAYCHSASVAHQIVSERQSMLKHSKFDIRLEPMPARDHVSTS